VSLVPTVAATVIKEAVHGRHAALTRSTRRAVRAGQPIELITLDDNLDTQLTLQRQTLIEERRVIALFMTRERHTLKASLPLDNQVCR
jgi:hypothetical protein